MRLIDAEELMRCTILNPNHPPYITRKDINAQPTIELERPKGEWIPCSERLPDEEYVLISKKPKKYFDGGRCVTIAIRMEDPRSRKVNWRDIGFGVIPDDKVLAWMPLPEPYGGDQNG